MFHTVESVAFSATKWFILLLECMGIIVLLRAGLLACWNYFRHKTSIRMQFAQGMATALSFKLCSEIMRTVIVRDYEELILVGAIIVLNAGLSFLIHWDIRTEKEVERIERQELQEEQQRKNGVRTEAPLMYAREKTHAATPESASE